MYLTCAQCNKSFSSNRNNAKFCSDNCRVLFHYHHSIKVKNVKPKKQSQGFTYENIVGKIIRKPMEDHVYHPQNILKMDDRTNYYRGKGIFGYDENTAIGYEDETSIE
jgi:hypothetical protein